VSLFFSIIIMWPLANNAAVAEIDVVRLGAVLVEEFDDTLVELARMVGVCGAGHHQDPAAAGKAPPSHTRPGTPTVQVPDGGGTMCYPHSYEPII
jgi:hypothetical protein